MIEVADNEQTDSAFFFREVIEAQLPEQMVIQSFLTAAGSLQGGAVVILGIGDVVLAVGFEVGLPFVLQLIRSLLGLRLFGRRLFGFEQGIGFKLLGDVLLKFYPGAAGV